MLDGGNSVSAKPVYHHFVNITKKIKPDFFSFIMPARWYSGGKGLDPFRSEMLDDQHISKLFDFPNSNDCFTNVDIAGGLCFFLWDKKNATQPTVINHIGDKIYESKRNLNDYEILIRDNKAVTILKKVLDWNESNSNLSQTVSSRKPFALATNYRPKSSGVPCWFIQKLGLSYASKSDVKDSNNYLGKWKLLIPPAPIAGQTNFTKSVGFYYSGNTVIAKPGECCTESYIIAGAFNTEDEILSFRSYLFTKVVRFLLLQRVISQHVTKKCFKFIPNLSKYNMTFSDEYLCKLWGITDEEWTYIDSKIHNMG